MDCKLKSTFDDAGIISPTAWTVLVSVLVTARSLL